MRLFTANAHFTLLAPRLRGNYPCTRSSRYVLRGVLSDWQLGKMLIPEVQHLTAGVEKHCRSGVFCWRMRSEMELLDSKVSSREESGLAIQIENRFYESEQFRKVHLEVAVTSNNLQIFHCVMYPHYTVDLPILAIDMIGKDEISFALADLCPVNENLTLPVQLSRIMQQLKGGLKSNRQVPEWAKEILSSEYLCFHPENSKQAWDFVHYVVSLSEAYFQTSKKAESNDSSVYYIKRAHQRFCEKNLENTKTSRVLESAFGVSMAKDYMKRVMFDAS